MKKFKAKEKKTPYTTMRTLDEVIALSKAIDALHPTTHKPVRVSPPVGAKRTELVRCECGFVVRRDSLRRHVKTQRHESIIKP